jgi:hypothetical protein
MRCAFLTLSCLIACKDKPPPPPPPAPAPPQDGVTLLQAGAPPFAALRYHLTRGAKTASELVYDFTIESDGKGGPAPTLIIDLETTVEDVAADGAARLRIAITRATTRDAPGAAAASEAARAQATAIQGVVITETLAADGRASGIHATAGATLPDSARAQLDSLVASLEHVATQLPAEPVGVGATWKERRTLPAGGIAGVSETVYTVTALAGDTFSYTSAGQLTGGRQTLERDGTKVEVTNSRGQSEARGTVDLSRNVLDVTVRSSFTSTMNALVAAETPGAGSSTIAITMATRMTPLAAAPEAEPPGDAGARDAPLPDRTPPDDRDRDHDGHGDEPADQGAHKAP